jgi:TonB family protein
LRTTGVIVTSLLLLATSLSAAGPFTLGSRSPKYSLTMDVQPLDGDRAQYSVRVTDLSTNQVVASPTFTAGPEDKPQSTTKAGDRQILVRIAHTPQYLSATLVVSEGNVVVDSMRTWWDLVPRPVPLATTREGVLRVGGDVKAPKVIKRVEPVYTEEARKARITGIVIVEAVIDKTGAVRETQVLKGLPNGLSEAALDAIKQWTFEPATKDGQPVDVIFNLTMNFQLSVKTNEQ